MAMAEVGRGIDIDGIKVGNAQDLDAGTGCTVVVCEAGAVGAVDVRGGGPATRETDLLRPENSVEAVNAIVLSGGSAFGLDAASGAMRYLEERGCGFAAGAVKVPIVCGASIFDLGVGSDAVRPDAQMGYEACMAAGPVGELAEGNVGAGTGATVGKLFGGMGMMKSGLGVAGVQMGDLVVDAIVSVNACGTVVDSRGESIAGVAMPVHGGDGSSDGAGGDDGSDGSGSGSAGAGLTVLPAREAELQMVAGMQQMLADPAAFAAMMGMGDGADAAPGDAGGQVGAGGAPSPGGPIENTTICCVVTNGKLTKAQACKAASMCHDGYARAIEPVHTSMDGDTVFVLATGEVAATLDMVGALGAIACEEAIRRAVLAAEPAYGIPSASSL